VRWFADCDIFANMVKVARLYACHHVVRVSMERHDWVGIIVPPHNEACFCFELGDYTHNGNPRHDQKFKPRFSHNETCFCFERGFIHVS